MSTPGGFQLGILPERKLDRRALAAAYGLLILLIVLMINIGWIWPDRLDISRQYHVTELIPMPSLQPKPLKMKPPPRTLRAKLLPVATVFEAPNEPLPSDKRPPHPQQMQDVADRTKVNSVPQTVLKHLTG